MHSTEQQLKKEFPFVVDDAARPRATHWHYLIENVMNKFYGYYC